MLLFKATIYQWCRKVGRKVGRKVAFVDNSWVAAHFWGGVAESRRKVTGQQGCHFGGFVANCVWDNRLDDHCGQTVCATLQ